MSSLLERAIRRGVCNAVGNAVGKAVRQAVEPKATEFANKAAGQIDAATIYFNTGEPQGGFYYKPDKKSFGLKGLFGI